MNGECFFYVPAVRSHNVTGVYLKPYLSDRVCVFVCVFLLLLLAALPAVSWANNVALIRGLSQPRHTLNHTSDM